MFTIKQVALMSAWLGLCFGFCFGCLMMVPDTLLSYVLESILNY